MNTTTPSKIVQIWFVLDMIVVLFPPIHWQVSDHALTIAGIPASLFYFLTSSIFIAGSVIFAYINDLEEK